MAFVLKDRVKETSTTTGTGTFTLAGAVSGFQSFSVIGNANTVYYAIVNLSASEWEVGLGTYTSSGTLLSRDTVLESSNSGSKVNFSAGTKDVFCTYPAEKAVTLDDVQTLSNKTIASPSVSGNLTFTGTGKRITGDFSNATHANRVAFQSSTTNGATSPFIIPNGTGTVASIVVANASDPTNSSFGQLAVATTTDVRVLSGQLGTGSYLPMTFYTGGSERMRVDTSGNVGIGTSSPTAKLHINSSSSPQIKFGGSDPAYYWALDRESLVGGNLQFSNANGGASTVRMTLDSSGNLLVGTTTSSVSSEQGIVLKPSEGLLANNSTSSGGVSLILLYSSFSTADQTKFEVTSEGNVKSRTNSYAGFSDERLKQNITPASSQWNDIKAYDVVKFQMKSEQFSDEENPWMIGVIAQQVEQVSPGLVDEDVKDGMKTVKYSILYMKAVKALQENMLRTEALESAIQEQQAIIEQLKADVAELKGQA